MIKKRRNIRFVDISIFSILSLYRHFKRLIHPSSWLNLHSCYILVYGYRPPLYIYNLFDKINQILQYKPTIYFSKHMTIITKLQCFGFSLPFYSKTLLTSKRGITFKIFSKCLHCCLF